MVGLTCRVQVSFMFGSRKAFTCIHWTTFSVNGLTKYFSYIVEASFVLLMHFWELVLACWYPDHCKVISRWVDAASVEPIMLIALWYKPWHMVSQVLEIISLTLHSFTYYSVAVHLLQAKYTSCFLVEHMNTCTLEITLPFLLIRFSY